MPIQRVSEAEYSKRAIESYSKLGKSVNMNWGSAGVYVVETGGSANVSVRFTDSFGKRWVIRDIPNLPAVSAAAHHRVVDGNTDGMTCVVDSNSGRLISLWQPRLEAGVLRVSTGGISEMGGAGWSKVGRGLPSLGRASGASYCGGLILPSELQLGEIHHALALAWPKNYVRALSMAGKAIQYPARISDGSSLSLDGTIPMGARLQLDPRLSKADLTRLGLRTRADHVIARALQKYGAFVVDSNPDNYSASLYFQAQFVSGKRVYKASNPFPAQIIQHLRFVAPAPAGVLDQIAPDEDQLPRRAEAE
jgi:hypothetical protein